MPLFNYTKKKWLEVNNMTALLNQYFLIFVGIIVSLLASRLAITIAKKYNIIDYPGRTSHGIHTTSTPLAGGMSIVISLFVILLVSELLFDHKIQIVFLSMLLVFIFGLIDDVRGLSALIKLCGQLIATAVIIFSGTRIGIFESPQFVLCGLGVWGYRLDIVLTMLWIVGLTNAFNLVDSMDGVSLGLATIVFTFLVLTSEESQDISLSLFAAAMAGIGLGLLFYNSYPAKVFLGDSGAQILGFVISVILINYSPVKSVNQNSSWFIPILLVAFPIFDTCLVFFSRIRRGKAFYKAHLDHTFHRLVKLGFEQHKAVQVIHLSAILLGSAAFFIIYLPPIFANLVFGMFVLLAGALIIWLDRKSSWA